MAFCGRASDNLSASVFSSSLSAWESSEREEVPKESDDKEDAGLDGEDGSVGGGLTVFWPTSSSYLQ